MSTEDKQLETLSSALKNLKPVAGKVQYCPNCGCHFLNGGGAANEKHTCPECGEDFRLLYPPE